MHNKDFLQSAYLGRKFELFEIKHIQTKQKLVGNLMSILMCLQNTIF